MKIPVGYTHFRILNSLEGDSWICFTKKPFKQKWLDGFREEDSFTMGQFLGENLSKYLKSIKIDNKTICFDDLDISMHLVV